MNKSEIASKLKLSIEDKLFSLGAYVDKELPEYILVMVANKKSRESMEKDLQLFLGQDTSIFIDWLHKLLDKIQENPQLILNSENSKISDVEMAEKRKKKEKSKNRKERKRSVEKKPVQKRVRKSRSRSFSPRKTNDLERKPKESSKNIKETHKKAKETPKKKTIETSEKTKDVTEKVSESSQVRKIKEATPDDTKISTKKDILDAKKEEIKRPEKTQIAADQPPVAATTAAVAHHISSTVKVAERPLQKCDTLKPSLIMVQRDIKETQLNNNNVKKSPQRSSVFSRLGKGDLRLTKLSKQSQQHRLSPDNVGGDDSDSYQNKINNINKILNNRKRLNERDDEEEEENRVQIKKKKMAVVVDRDVPEDEYGDSEDLWYRRPKKTIESQQHKEEDAVKVVDTNFIVTLKGADRLNLPLLSRLGPKKSLSNDNNNAVAMDCEEEGEDEESVQQPLQEHEEEEEETVTVLGAPPPVSQSQLAQKCKFWPNCKNQDTLSPCPFFHPVEKCTNFPLCKFGQSCLFIHPDCRFDYKCTKIDCQFTHRQPRQLLIGGNVGGGIGGVSYHKQSNIAAMAGGLQHQRCLYYPNCTNVNCKYFHPNLPCKFGLACKAKATCMFYHPSIPNRNELTWVAPKDSTADGAIVTNKVAPLSEVQSA